MLRLADTASCEVLYEDRTRFGSQISRRVDRLVRSALHGAARMREREGFAKVVACTDRLLDEALCGGGLASLYAKPFQLHEECLYPPSTQIRPNAVMLRASSGNQWRRVPLEQGVTGDLARWVSEWETKAERPLSAFGRRLWDAFREAGAFVAMPPQPAIGGDLLFAGHASVRIGCRGSQVLFDPFLQPWSEANPPNYQPLTAGELKPDAIFITHSHPDHYNLGSLLRFAHTPIYVPAVERESILSIDMAARLTELGFERVHRLSCWQQVDIGVTRVTALPFTGEQPTDSSWLHPQVRNHGHVYLVESGKRRYAICADAGQDHTGDVRQLARQACRRFGAVDVVIGGYRGWSVYPIAYLFQSISRYLLFVPRDSWKVRQHIMNDADDLLDTAEAWHATWVVPYADGGAPWYWSLGLGPDLSACQSEAQNPHVDPRPEVVRTAALNRSSDKGVAIASPVRVCLLRPAQTLTLQPEPLTEWVGGRCWPYVSGDNVPS